MNPELLEKRKEQGRDFSKLDLNYLTKKYKLKKLSYHGDILYVTSQQDDWFIEYDKEFDTWTLYHKNKWNKSKKFHKEHMHFNTVFQILGYINHHDGKVFALGHKGVYKKSRIEQLFDQINNSNTKIASV